MRGSERSSSCAFGTACLWCKSRSTEKHVEVRSAPAVIWKIWSDVENWPAWQKDVAWSNLDGPFQAGTTGVLKPSSGPKTRFEITELELEKSFVDCSFLPLSKMYFIHELEALPSGVRVKHRIELKGPLAWLFKALLGRNLERGLESALGWLKETAETLSEKSFNASASSAHAGE